MLGYVARTLPLLVRARLRKSQRLVSRLERRVALSEVDYNLHMNQAVYAQVGELGRTDWILGVGAWDRWRADGINPVVAEQRIIYRREMKPRQRYAVDTRATGMDGRLLCLDSHLIVGDRVHAKLEVKLIFVGPNGVLSVEAAEAACEGLVTDALAVNAWVTKPS